ncbi:MAG: tRNA pseudouridine synthase [Myxococcaceae bacterium]|nr:tRNA pseudouridine synthase [Myxococcaceae bacterium]
MARSTEDTPFGVCLRVAYDGTDFAGSQLQLAQRTVQGELERAAEIMTGHPTRMRAAGRTDAGVHALAQVVAFDSARDIPARGWFLGINRSLPDDVRVQRVAPCAVGYNPRFDALAKTYRYLVQTGATQNPLMRERAYQVNRLWQLDLGAMQQAARMLEGTHDFRAFRQADDVRENTVRTFYSVEVAERLDDPSMIGITVRGTAFMKNMVRILAGTLIDIGRGRIPLSRVPALLSKEAERLHAGHTAPAHGLTLMQVELGRKGLPSPFAAEPPLVYP